ncbi:MAG: DnaD domain protein [Oscillospiraceae bacterium]|nr:DnaD domain protein [Oscillospiraceae bacterium]
MKDTFILKTDYIEYFRQLSLSVEDVGRLMLAVFNYQAADLQPTVDELGGVLYSAFMIIKVDLDKNHQKYVEKCRKMRENGQKGGRPPKEAERRCENQNKAIGLSESNCPQMEQTGLDNDSGIDIDNDIDNAVINAAAGSAAAAGDSVQRLYEELIGPWNSHVKKTLASFALPPELICYAITEASSNNVLKLSYITKILEAKKAAGATDVESARARPKVKGDIDTPRKGTYPPKSGLDPQAVAEMRRRIGKSSGVRNEE